VQSVIDHHKPSRHHRPFSRDESVRRQPPTDARVYPDYPAPVVRNAGAERELAMMRWGMPPPPRAGSYPVTNIRNTVFTSLASLAEAGESLFGPGKQFCGIRAGSSHALNPVWRISHEFRVLLLLFRSFARWG